MLAKDAQRILASITSQQWGLVTTKQAALRGVTRLQLSRLADDGVLVHCARGIYRDAGAPADPREGIKALWLSMRPDLMAYERLAADLSDDAIVSGAAAAWLHGVGTLIPEPYEFTVCSRRQTTRAELSFRIRRLARSEITVREGLPVTIIERTIADLVDEDCDLSLVGDVVSDAAAIDGLRVIPLLEPLAHRNGFSDGSALWNHLAELAGRDVQSLVQQITFSPLAPAIVEKYLRNIDLVRSQAPQIPPIVVELAEKISAIDDQLRSRLPEIPAPPNTPRQPLVLDRLNKIGEGLSRAQQAMDPWPDGNSSSQSRQS